MDRPRNVLCVMKTSEATPFPITLRIAVTAKMVDSQVIYEAYREDIEASLNVYGMKNKIMLHTIEPIITLLGEGEGDQINYHVIDLIEYP